MLHVFYLYTLSRTYILLSSRISVNLFTLLIFLSWFVHFCHNHSCYLTLLAASAQCFWNCEEILAVQELPLKRSASVTKWYTLYKHLAEVIPGVARHALSGRLLWQNWYGRIWGGAVFCAALGNSQRNTTVWWSTETEIFFQMSLPDNTYRNRNRFRPQGNKLVLLSSLKYSAFVTF